jgi:hypothetical protein
MEPTSLHCEPLRKSRLLEGVPSGGWLNKRNFGGASWLRQSSMALTGQRPDAIVLEIAGAQPRAAHPACLLRIPLQCSSMHIEAARGLRNVSPAGLMNLLDMLQAHIGWRHGALWRLSFAAQWSLQCRDNVIRIHRFRKIVDGAEFSCLHGSRNIAVAGQNNSARIGSLLHERRNNVQASPVFESQVYHGIFRCTQLNLS